jgi:4-hydroxyphenylpyruvate dioxygenase
LVSNQGFYSLGELAMSSFPINRFDHLEFYVGNARQAAVFYTKCFGFINTAYRGLETGSRDVASYVLEQGDIRLVVSTALSADHAIAQAALKHGDHVAAIALDVLDVTTAFKEATARGAIAVTEPTELEDGKGLFRYAAIQGYGDTVIKFVDRSDYSGSFAPGFERRYARESQATNPGLKAIDHIVGNVELGAMEPWVKFFSETMGFETLVRFDDRAISTEYSALMSTVVQNPTGKIKFPINEPAPGKRKSQIEEYLDYNNGPGVQHIALATDNIIATVSQLRASGVEFLDVPETYYQDLEQRVGRINEATQQLAALGILVDRDNKGYLLQIFTQPLQDRPTLFFEVIQRCGAEGFGEGNFKSLFEAIEREQQVRGNL